MLFNSFTFLVFFSIVLGVFYLLRSWSARKTLLLIASYVFYAAWSVPYVLLLIAATIADWNLARWIDRSPDERRRRQLLVLSLLCNLGALSYFKYAGFLVENFNALLALAGFAPQVNVPSIVLPLGISFFTFASLSYTIDVYRRNIRATATFGDYALFITFFPHLIAGPIVRAAYLLPQIARPSLPSRNDLGWGLTLVLLGLSAKVTLADGMLADFVNEIFAAPGRAAIGEVWAAVLAFSSQIYLDFCGYSLCAIGLAQCFGFKFPDNFRYPYAASGFSDFWRRWHISLSTWLRDYLYIPLGGNHGKWMTYRNLMLTMLIGGLWHGASWMFVLWGGLHGLYLVIERWWRQFGWPASSWQPPLFAKIFLTYIVVTLTWIPFRASGGSEALAIASALFFGKLERLSDNAILALIVTALVLCCNFALRERTLRQVFEAMNVWAHGALLLVCLLGMFLMSANNARMFIYFQF